MSLTATLSFGVKSKEIVSGDFEAGNSQISMAKALAFASGAGAGQANLIFSDRRTLALSSNESLDLAGSLAGLLGAKVFTRVKAIYIFSAASNPADGVLRVTRPASNGVPFPNITAGDSIVPDLTPGAVRMLADVTAAGIAVTASTGDLINFANSSGTAAATYDIIVLGADA